ncbi:MAG: hypothetical protein WBD31_29815 [Rubripirellula sp.]
MRGDSWSGRLLCGVFAIVLAVGAACSVNADQAKAEHWLAKAVESSAQIETPSAISNAAKSLARVHARLGQVEAAFSAAKRVTDPQLKLYALRSTVQAAVDSDLATTAMVDEAKRTFEGNEGAFNQSTMKKLLHIAESKSKTVSPEQPNSPPPPSPDSLTKAFDKAADRDAKIAAFTPLATQLLQSQSFDALDSVVERAVAAVEQDPRPDVSSKFGTYGDLASIAKIRGMQLRAAIMLANEGQVAAATRHLEIVDPLIDALPDQAALVKWEMQDLRIRLLLKLERTEDAITQLKKIQSPLIVSRAAAAIAAHQIESGEVDAGLKMAKRIGDEPGSGAASGEVAIALFQHGDRDVAVEFVNQLGTSDETMYAFDSLARHWVETDNAEQLESVFDVLESPEARTHYAVSAAEHLKLDRPRR